MNYVVIPVGGIYHICKYHHCLVLLIPTRSSTWHLPPIANLNTSNSQNSSNTQPKMCIETTTTYENCNAVRIHTVVCDKHIEYTRQQIDTRPCPDFRKTSQYGAATTRCDCKYRPRGFECARAKSKGYGENGLTWDFERAPAIALKKQKDRARDKARMEIKDEGAENIWDENYNGRGRRGAIDLGRLGDINNEDE